MPKIIQAKYKILGNKKVGPDYYKMKVRAPMIVRLARAGQFVHLRCSDGVEPLLRRPFSFHRLNGNSFEILYEVVGRGTELLAKKKRGETIDVLGPLGNGFELSTVNCELSTILIAGGMGVAPLLALAEKLLKAQKHSKLRSIRRKNNILVFLGAKNKKRILCEGDFRKLGLPVQVATDDGSKGFKGPVTELLKKILRLSTLNPQLSTVYACGPKPMLKELAGIARKCRLWAFASLEENIACGVGACLGCAIATKSGYRRVCKDGPVFNLKEIKWQDQA